MNLRLRMKKKKGRNEKEGGLQSKICGQKLDNQKEERMRKEEEE